MRTRSTRKGSRFKYTFNPLDIHNTPLSLSLSLFCLPSRHFVKHSDFFLFFVLLFNLFLCVYFEMFLFFSSTSPNFFKQRRRLIFAPLTTRLLSTHRTNRQADTDSFFFSIRLSLLEHVHDKLLQVLRKIIAIQFA